MTSFPISRKFNPIFIVLILGCIVIISASLLLTQSQSRHQNGLQVDSDTQAFQVISAERTGRYIRVLLKNNSSRGINGYTISVDDAQITKDITIANRVIAPGETDEFHVPGDDNPSPEIRVLAVIFDNGMTDGNPSASAQLKGRRLGLKTQLQRILHLLQKALNDRQLDTRAAIDRLKTDISSLSERPDSTLPPESVGGLHDMREEVLSAIEDLGLSQETQKSVLQGKLKLLKSHLEQRLAAL